MQTPVQITFRNMDPSEAVETAIREKADKLEKFVDSIDSCHVVVETPHRHHNKQVHMVRVHLNVPGHEIMAGDIEKPEHTDVYIAIRDAFDAAQRQLQDFRAKQQKR